MIYLDQAATSYPKPPGVVQAIGQALNTVGNSGRGAHALSLEASRLIFDARLAVAEFFGGVSPNQIAFTNNATESLNLALFGLLMPGDHVITTVWEHNSVLRPLYRLASRGVKLSFIPANSLGELDLDQLKHIIRPNTKALVCTHASNVTGNLVDLLYLSNFCLEHNLTFIVDGAQTAGTIPLDLEQANMDVFCFTGHKALGGPQGIGGIYVRKGLKIEPLKVGGSGIDSFSPNHPWQMPEALEAGTLNTPGIAGLMAGIQYIEEQGLTKIAEKEQALTNYFYNAAIKIKNVKVYGTYVDQNRCPIVALNIMGLDAGYVSQILAEQYGIYTRAGAHCAPLMHQALGTEKRGIVRFSFAHCNTFSELDQALNALDRIC